MNRYVSQNVCFINLIALVYIYKSVFNPFLKNRQKGYGEYNKKSIKSVPAYTGYANGGRRHPKMRQNYFLSVLHNKGDLFVGDTMSRTHTLSIVIIII